MKRLRLVCWELIIELHIQIRNITLVWYERVCWGSWLECSCLDLLEDQVRIALVLVRLQIGIRHPRYLCVVLMENRILSILDEITVNLLEHVSRRNSMWMTAKAAMIYGRIKWKANNHVRLPYQLRTLLRFIWLVKCQCKELLKGGLWWLLPFRGIFGLMVKCNLWML